MIVIKIELWPLGDHTQAKSLGMATISNLPSPPEVGPGRGIKRKSRGSYRIKLFKAGEALVVFKEDIVKDFLRTRYGAWYLLAGALNIVLPDWRKAFDNELPNPDHRQQPVPTQRYQIDGTGEIFESPILY